MRDLFKSVAIMKERFTSIWTQDACMGYTSLLSHLSKVKTIILTQPDQQRKQACRVPQLGNDGITHCANLWTSWHGGGKTSQEANKDQNLGSLHHCRLPRCCQSWGIGKKQVWKSWSNSVQLQSRSALTMFCSEVDIASRWVSETLVAVAKDLVVAVVLGAS